MQDCLRTNSFGRLLDFGCGEAALYDEICIQKKLRPVVDLYHGIDVRKYIIDWNICRNDKKWASFSWLDAENERYRPDGSGEKFPDVVVSDEVCPIGLYHTICLFSVFSHFRWADIQFYLAKLQNVLKPGGRMLFTAFVEDDLPEVEVENYNGMETRLAANFIRRQELEARLESLSLAVQRIRRKAYGDNGQDIYVVKNADV
jgi:SAM-dependent methyltransferase